MEALERITERVCCNGHPDDPETPRPLLSIDEFFEGNDVVGSIGCNLIDIPHPNEFFKVLKAIINRPDVKDIRIQVSAFDDPDWPFSDTVYIMTSASESEVGSWFPEHLKPDEIWEGFVNQDYEAYEIPAETRPVAVWWD